MALTAPLAPRFTPVTKPFPRDVRIYHNHYACRARATSRAYHKIRRCARANRRTIANERNAGAFTDPGRSGRLRISVAIVP